MHTPEATRQVTDPRIEHGLGQEIGSSRDELPFDVPPVHTTRTRAGYRGCWRRPVSRTCDDVQIVCLLQPVKQDVSQFQTASRTNVT